MKKVKIKAILPTPFALSLSKGFEWPNVEHLEKGRLFARYLFFTRYLVANIFKPFDKLRANGERKNIWQLNSYSMIKKYYFFFYYLLLISIIPLTATPKKVLVINPTLSEQKELAAFAIQSKYRFIYHRIYNQDYSLQQGSMKALVRNMKKKYKRHKLDGILCTQDYLGNICGCLLAQELKLPGPSIISVLTCHHKYYSRIAQARYVPHATPSFGLIDPDHVDKSLQKLPLTFPFFIKPVKAYFSFGATTVHSKKELKNTTSSSMPEKSFLEPFNAVLSEHTPFLLSANYLLAESILKGHQCTIEGFIRNGRCYILGVIDSVMYPGTISFHHFEYPSQLPKEVQHRMAKIAQNIMGGLTFDNSFFNIEMMYNPLSNQIHIIEINPRSVAQFADFYEKVHGLNSYEIMLAIVTNSALPACKKKGAYAIAASFALRTFANGRVIHSPTKDDLAKIYQLFPDARIQLHVQKGQTLSEELQDGKSYLYAIINIGGKNRKDLMNRFEQCKKLLPYTIQ